MRRIIFAIATTLITQTAMSYNNFYFELGGGYVNTTQNSSTTTISHFANLGVPLFNLPQVEWDNILKNGVEGSMTLGMNFFPHWRMGGEFLYQNIKRNIEGSYDWQETNPNGGDTFQSTFGNPISDSSNRLHVYALLMNVEYDFVNQSKWTPSLGAGLGIAWIQSDRTISHSRLAVTDLTTSTVTTYPVTATSPTLSNTPFAWQVKAGLAYLINPSLSIVGQYRLFATTGFSSSDSNITLNANTASPTSFYIPGKQVRGLLNNGFDINIRYVF